MQMEVALLRRAAVQRFGTLEVIWHQSSSVLSHRIELTKFVVSLSGSALSFGSDYNRNSHAIIFMNY